MTTSRSRQPGPEARPVAAPDDAADPALEKAHGWVELPLHVRWSGPPQVYDLDHRADRLRVYEQVLREGNDDDVRRFVDVSELLVLWDDLVLPHYVRRGARQARGRRTLCAGIVFDGDALMGWSAVGGLAQTASGRWPACGRPSSASR